MATDDELRDDEPETILDGLIQSEMGEHLAGIFRRVRREEEARYRAAHPDEGLRERKRRLTRQLISDAATTMFASRGFDAVKVADVARRVGVSEKTIYNYFPTKESMVLDTADEMVDNLATALRERPPGSSITEAVVRALQADMARFDVADDDVADLLPAFFGMFEHTPALRAAYLELHDRLARVATEELAAQAGIDPRDPEPVIAGRALAGLTEVGTTSRLRHTQDGLRGAELERVVIEDIRRAARLLDTGLWSFQMPRTERARSQAREAARAAEEARVQVVAALREARRAWEEVRRTGQATAAEVRAGEAAMRAAALDAKEAARQARRAGGDARRAARREARRPRPNPGPGQGPAPDAR